MMIWTILLTFIITALTGMVLFLLRETNARKRAYYRVLRENGDLRHMMAEHNANERRRRATYRQQSRDREQVEATMNSESKGA